MVEFTIHTLETAPAAAQEALAASNKKNGRIPGLHGVMAEAPNLLKTYGFAHEQFLDSSMTKEELTVVWQSINVENECHYCVPAHTGIANMMGIDPEITQALRDETPLPTPRLEALRTFTLLVVRNRGFVSDEDTAAFFDAGFNQQNILEVILGYSQKIMSNYVNHFAKTPVDTVFEKYQWTKKA